MNRRYEVRGDTFAQEIPWGDFPEGMSGWEALSQNFSRIPPEILRTPRRVEILSELIAWESDWLPGFDLRQYAQIVDRAELLDAFWRALDLLERLHRPPLSLLHGDVSPKNILVSGQKVIWIDPESLEPVAQAKAFPCFRAKPAYLAPERARSGKNSLSAEVFAAGAILFEIIFGASLFEHGEYGFSEALNFSEDTLKTRLSGVGKAERKFFLRALAADPHTRFLSVGELLQEGQPTFR